jgi:WD40 repeat protein
MAAAQPQLVVQTGHTSTICSLAVAPDGQRALTGGADKTARLWDVATGREVLRLDGHCQVILSVAISPDGGRLLTGGIDASARLWDAATGKQLLRLQGQSPLAIVNAVAFSPDGTQALTGTLDQRAQLWDLSTGKVVQVFKGHTGGVRAVAFRPDGRMVLTGSLDGTARLWDAASGQTVQRFEGHEKGVVCVAFASDGRRALTGSDDMTARLWDAATGRELKRFGPHPAAVYSIALAPDGGLAAVCCQDGECRLWDLNTGKAAGRVQGYLTAISQDGKRLFTACRDAAVRLWDPSSGTETGSLASRAGGVNAVAFSPDGQRLLVASSDGKARLWDAMTGREVRCLAGHEDEATCGVFAPDGRIVLTAGGGYMSRDHTLRLWDGATGKEVRRFTGHTDEVSAAAFSPDGRSVLTAGGGYSNRDHTVRLWDVSTAKEVRRFTGHAAAVRAVAFSPDGRRAVTASWDTTARVWDVATGKQLAKFQELGRSLVRKPGIADNRPAEYLDITDRLQQLQNADLSKPENLPDLSDLGDLSKLVTVVNLVSTATFSPDGRHIATGGTDWQVRLWDVETGKLVRRIPWPVRLAEIVPGGRLALSTRGLSAVTFSRDGRLLLVGGEDGAARIYDPTSGKELFALRGHHGPVTSVAFAPNGHRAVTGGLDGTARFWDAASGRELARLIGLRSGEEWLAATPEGYFAASLEGRRMVSWRVGEQLFPLELYEKRFDRPDLVSQAIRGGAISGQPSVPGGRTPPQVRLKVEQQTEEGVTVTAHAMAGGTEAKVVAVRFFVDGRDLPSQRTRDLVLVEQDAQTAVYRAVLAFPPGKPTASIDAVAVDDLGLESEPANLKVTRSIPPTRIPSTLHVLAVGVSRYRATEYNLEFCDADAKDFAAALAAQKAKAFDDVRATVLVNEEATGRRILAEIDRLKEVSGPADVVLVHFSGHGVRGRRGLYYVTHEGDLDDLNGTCVNWRQMAERLGAVRARQVLFFADCCHAGAFGEQGARPDELAEPLVKQAGVMVFASSRGSERAAENSQWGHGAFVRALLDGLQGEADLIPDGRITISELQTYVVDRVARMTADQQHPYLPRLERFDPGLVIALTRPPAKH